jgi:FAD-linked sulfhydryl oxidase
MVDFSPNVAQPVLGPDGKPCKACTSLNSFQSSTKALLNPVANKARAECPADKDALGHATWTFLHTTAAYYPNKPTVIQQTQMFNLLNSLPHLYPCGHCAEHLKGVMEDPGKGVTKNVVKSQEGVARWLCSRHNEVNALLGKEEWDCTDFMRLRGRWRDGPADGSCD